MTAEMLDPTIPFDATHTALPGRGFELGLSENPFPPLPSVLKALNNVMAHANRYPEFLPERLPRVIANRIGVMPDQVVVGSGATGVAMQIMQAVMKAGERIVFAMPNFDGYPIMASIVGVRATPVPMDTAGRQDLRRMALTVDRKTSVMVVCRPHNPTGTLVTATELEQFLNAIPRRVVVILDEAYVEFVNDANAIDARALVERHPNLLVLRTFSKAHGLAGLRIGYAFGSHELVERVRRWQLPFGVNSAAVAAVTASYAAEHELQDRVARITSEREYLRNALLRMGVRVPRSFANFLYLKGPDIAPKLTRAGITVKAYPDGSARIAVGDPAASRAVLEALSHA
ncbi:aminotransferase class I/II-fold pyridoxal phosphate-dependent enzyme [Antrihabitans sp. YC2-6]|uniref:aminotransferase class I/II-fold pyridoxal phosphate-dependent enzyme n=1 Tax=Antrihabitans sp. YC2-6 TaxID=2799498 RepID=UPI0018F7595B|nr:aminotransferase class I/II-fold pyridoxal phosphate-dependent enzyme [Antrihabitans sp. YC2-6]MBJ8347679.1 aminotransferase class I/II-fold pyridoxal phosphate-dependent enzyme [Antrihabitans sp. YC2-6]